jgi:8-oxo-dGTP diphosphatase
MTLPITFSLVLARSEAGYLLVRNKTRGVWELPGGLFDAGESPRLCATREPEEESGQSDVCLRWCAVLELAAPATGTSYGALYCGDVATSAPFTRNAEIDSVGFWRESELPADTSNTDRALVACFA